MHPKAPMLRKAGTRGRAMEHTARRQHDCQRRHSDTYTEGTPPTNSIPYLYHVISHPPYSSANQAPTFSLVPILELEMRQKLYKISSQ